MKKYINYLGWVLFFLLLWFKGCDQTTKTSEKIKVVTKEIKGESIIKNKIVHVPITKKIRDTSGVGFYVNQIDKLFEENNRMQLDFQKMDSLAQIQSYAKAIEINAFKERFEDNYIDAYVSGNVSGKIKEMRFDYTLKPQTLIVDAPKVKNKYFVGFGVSNNSQFNAPLFNVGVGIQNKKGRVLFATYDNEKRIGLNYFIKVF